MYLPPGIHLRQAAWGDLDFLIKSELLASTPPFPRSFWDEMAEEFGRTGFQLVESLFKAGAHAWGGPEDHRIIEVDGKPAGSCSLLFPDPLDPDHRPIRWESFPAAAELLGWSLSDCERFERRYDQEFGPAEAPHLKPQARAIIESVAIHPGHQGRGLGALLIQACLDEAEARGAASAGILALTGNDRAERLYLKLGFEPCITFNRSYFEGAIEGMTKLRMELPRPKAAWGS